MNLLEKVFGINPTPEDEKTMRSILDGAKAALDPKAGVVVPDHNLLELECRTCKKRAAGDLLPADAMERTQYWFKKHPRPEHDSHARYSPERRRMVDRRKA